MAKRVKAKRERVISLLLAIFLGIWTWLYTYKYDKKKFWWGLILSVVLFWTVVVPIGFYIWAIVDAATKDEKIYKRY